ncbi:MAG: tripartite tricarboxylate transporter substrate binding protein [Verrucomicrobiota bacterium]
MLRWVVWLFLWASPALCDEAFPRKPIKVIVPFGSGGASDTTARILQEGMRRSGVSSHPWVIVNVPGVGGTIGSRRVRQARPDGYTLLNLHDGIFTARLAGAVTYGPEAFAPVASTGFSGTVVATGPGRDWSGLAEPLALAADSAEPILYGGNLGAPSEFIGRLIEAQREGASFQFVPLGGGAERYARLVGGHVDLSVFSLSEFREFQQSDDQPDGLRGLAYLGPHRHELVPDLATAREQGYDLIGGTTQFWWAPAGTPAAEVEWLAASLGKAIRTPFVVERYRELGIDPVFKTGAELDQLIDETGSRYRAVGDQAITDVRALPIVPVAFGFFCCVLLIFALKRFRAQSKQSQETAHFNEWRKPSLIIGLLLGYLLAIQFRVLPYGWLTFVFLLVGFLSLCRFSRNQLVWSLAVASVVAASLAWVFKGVLLIDLP